MHGDLNNNPDKHGWLQGISHEANRSL